MPKTVKEIEISKINLGEIECDLTITVDGPGFCFQLTLSASEAEQFLGQLSVGILALKGANFERAKPKKSPTVAEPQP